jgi:hypothetical protein
MTDLAAPQEHPDLSIDQQLALRTAATNLGRQFGDIYGIETIERFLASSYDQFATTSTIPNFLPLLAERFARQRLEALARVEGHHRDACPIFPGTRYENWDLPDPAGLEVADVRPIRDDLERRVHALLDQLALPVA